METLQRTANRGSVSTGYDVDNSAVFEADDSSYIRFTNISTYYSSARAKKFSNSVWIKQTELGKTNNMILSYAQNGYLEFSSTGELKFLMAFRSGSSGAGTQKELKSNAKFRDTNAWYHIVVAVDTAQSTEADRVKIYVNGVQITSWATEQYPNQNDESANVYEQHNYIGTWGGGDHTNTGFCGYVAEFYFLSEIAASPTDFGEFDEDTGIWKPKEYTAATITSPSSYLNFSNASNLAEATSGQDWASGNVNNVEQATDTCTNNFCTYSPLFIYAYNLTISQGGQQVFANAANWQGAKGSVGLQNGRWYWEVKIPSANNSGFTGIQTVGESNIGSGNAQSNNSTYCRKGDGGDIFYYGGSESTSTHGGGNMSDNNIIGVFLDLESSTKTLRWFKNGSSYGSTIGLAAQSTSFTTREVFPFYANITSGNGAYFNFGGHTSFTISSAVVDSNGYGAFEYTPNDGTYDYYSICTKNLAEFG